MQGFQPFSLADTLNAVEGVRARRAQADYYDTRRQDAADERRRRQEIRDIARQSVTETPGAVTGSEPMPGGREVTRAPSSYDYDPQTHRSLLLKAGYLDEAQALQGSEMERTTRGLQFIAAAAPQVYNQQSYDRFRNTLESAGLASPGELPAQWTPETQTLLTRMTGAAQEQYGQITQVHGWLGQYDSKGQFHSIGKAGGGEKPRDMETREIGGVLYERRKGSDEPWRQSRREPTAAEMAAGGEAGYEVGMATGAGARGPSGGRGPGVAGRQRVRDIIGQAGVPVTTGDSAEWSVDNSLGYPVLRNQRTGDMKNIPKPPREGMEVKTDSLGNMTAYQNGTPAYTLPLGAEAWEPVPPMPGMPAPGGGAGAMGDPASDPRAYAQLALNSGYDAAQIRSALDQRFGPGTADQILPPMPAGGQGGGGTFQPTPTREDLAAQEATARAISAGQADAFGQPTAAAPPPPQRQFFPGGPQTGVLINPPEAPRDPSVTDILRRVTGAISGGAPENPDAQALRAIGDRIASETDPRELERLRANLKAQRPDLLRAVDDAIDARLQELGSKGTAGVRG